MSMVQENASTLVFGFIGIIIAIASFIMIVLISSGIAGYC